MLDQRTWERCPYCGETKTVSGEYTKDKVEEDTPTRLSTLLIPFNTTELELSMQTCFVIETDICWGCGASRNIRVTIANVPLSEIRKKMNQGNQG